MKSCNDLKFLSIYWEEAKKVAKNIKENLPKGSVEYSNEIKSIQTANNVKMFTVQYSDLQNTWSPSEILNKIGGESKSLKALADKIEYMILKGRAKDVEPMIIAILSREKHFGHKQSNHSKKMGYHFAEYYGKGHFKWNFQAYKLNGAELRKVAEYFNLVPTPRLQIKQSYEI